MAKNKKGRMQVPMNPSRRWYTRKQVEQRRLGVWDMLSLGESLSNIAQSYGVSPRTIERDIAWWRERLGRGAEDLKDPENAAIDVGTTAKRLEKIFEDAYVEFNATANVTAKVRFLQAATQAIVTRHKLLADSGFLPKVGHEKERPQQVQISFEARFGKESVESVLDDPKSRRKVLDAAVSVFKAGAMKGQLPLKEADVVETEAVEKTQGGEDVA